MNNQQTPCSLKETNYAPMQVQCMLTCCSMFCIRPFTCKRSTMPRGNSFKNIVTTLEPSYYNTASTFPNISWIYTSSSSRSSAVMLCLVMKFRGNLEVHNTLSGVPLFTFQAQKVNVVSEVANRIPAPLFTQNGV